MKRLFILFILLFSASPAFAADRHYVYNNITGLIESGGGTDLVRNQAIAATKPQWNVITVHRSIRGQVRVDIPGLFLRKWNQVEIDAKIAANAQAAADKAVRIQALKDKMSNITRAQLNNYIDNNVTDLPGAVAYLKRLSAIVQDLVIESGM